MPVYCEMPKVGDRVRVRISTWDGIREVNAVVVFEKPRWCDGAVPPRLMAKYRTRDGTTDTVGISLDRLLEVHPAPETGHFKACHLLPGDQIECRGELKTVASVKLGLLRKRVKVRFGDEWFAEKHPVDEVVTVKF